MTDRSAVVLVTGVAGQIGGSVAEVLTERGVAVVGVDLEVPHADGIRSHKVDLTDERAVRRAAEAVRTEYGALDAIVHAAAWTGRSADLHPHTLRTVDLEVWRRMLEVNLTAALICVREFGPMLRVGSQAQILLVGSIQGLVPTMGTSAYAVSKAALIGLVRQLAAELAPTGVRVNLVAPGPVADDRELARLRARDREESPTPLGRYGGVRELAESVADLVTGSFGLMTGVTIPLDGGEHLRPRTAPARANDPDRTSIDG